MIEKYHVVIGKILLGIAIIIAAMIIAEGLDDAAIRIVRVLGNL